MSIILPAFMLHWYLSLFCQTFFLHRYSAHKMFSLSRFWEKFFYVLTFLTQGSSFLNPRAYAILHRMHHAYSDSAKDPHSPQFFSNVGAMMWRTRQIYAGLCARTISPEKGFDAGVPVWPIFDEVAESYAMRFVWILVYIWFYATFATAWWMYLILPFHVAIGAIQGAVVNWCGHKYGYSNFDNHDASKNTLFWDLLMMGELYQNNHHHNPSRVNFAYRWYEFDPTYPLVKLLSLVRIVR